jgi:hypothetical protein
MPNPSLKMSKVIPQVIPKAMLVHRRSVEQNRPKSKAQGAKVRVQNYLVRSSEKTTHRNEQVVPTNRAIVREKSLRGLVILTAETWHRT